MVSSSEFPRSTVVRTGLALGLVLGAVSLVAIELVLPRFLDSVFQVLALALIAAILGGVCSGIISLFSPRNAAGGTAGLITMVMALGIGKLLFPAATWGLVVAAIVVGLVVGAGVRSRGPLREKRLTVAGIVVVLIAASLALVLSRDRAINPKLVVIGLDAGTWTVLDELFAQQDLPNFRWMVDDGVSGTLLSEEPTLSPRVWTSIATGKGPINHGIEDFFSTQNRDLTAARFWEILIRFDFTVGLFRWLVTWPPEPVGPFNVPGWMARDASTVPEALSFVKEVERKFQNDVKASLGVSEALRWGALYLRAGVDLRTCLDVVGLSLRQGVGDKPWEVGYATKRTMHDLLNMDVFLELMQEHQPDVAAVVFYGSDNLAHKVWKYRYPEEFGLDPDKAYIGEFLDNYYREVDRFLGELRSLIGEETTLLLVSDHGYASAEHDTNGPERQTVFKPRMVRILEFLELESPTEATVASVSTRGYITFQGEPQEREGRLEAARATLGGVKGVDSGLPIFRLTRTDSGQLEVAIDEEHGDFDEQTKLESMGGSLVLSDLVEVEERAGGHSVEGVILAQGPDVRSNVRLPDTHLVDIAPTLLYLLGVPVAEDMDGRIVEEMIEPEFLTRNPPESVTSYDELILQQREQGWEEGDEETLKKELEALGYLN